MILPLPMREVIIPRITASTDQDLLHEMIVCCYEVASEYKLFSKAKAVLKIDTMIHIRNRENSILYNPYRNISLNQCVGESHVPVSEWINLSDWQEWE